MKERLMVGLLASGLVAAMLPAVAVANGNAPRVDTTGYCVALGADPAAFYGPDGTWGPWAWHPKASSPSGYAGSGVAANDTPAPMGGGNACRVPSTRD